MPRRNKAIWLSIAVIGFIVAAGIAGISIQANEPVVAKHPNDRANHHPRHLNN